MAGPTKAELEAENAELKQKLAEAEEQNGVFPARTGAKLSNVAKPPGAVQGGSVVEEKVEDEEPSE